MAVMVVLVSKLAEVMMTILTVMLVTAGEGEGRGTGREVNTLYVMCQHVHSKTKKKKEQTLKRSIFAIRTELLHSHFSFIINHQEHLGLLLGNFTTQRLHKFSISP